MGMYTEFAGVVDLKADRPSSVDKALHHMMGDRSEFGDDWPGWNDHALFKCARWRFLLHSAGAAYQLAQGSSLDEFGQLKMSFSVKNYDGEIDHLLDWLTPHVEWTYPMFVGYVRYEEQDDPTLIYWDGKRFVDRYPKYLDDLWVETER